MIDPLLAICPTKRRAPFAPLDEIPIYQIARNASQATILCFAWWVSISLIQAEEPFGFVDKFFSAWMSLDGSPVNDSWQIEDNVVHLVKGEKRGGHIVTKEEFTSFSLIFEFKIAPKGNSGIKYMVQRYGNRFLGLEYQIYDDAGAKGVRNRNSTGSIYDLFEPNQDKKLRPAGEWNEAKISVKNSEIEHWLNGKLIVKATIGDEAWEKNYSQSKFNDVPDFRKSRKGRIMLTDHGSEVWYRNFDFTDLTDR